MRIKSFPDFTEGRIVGGTSVSFGLFFSGNRMECTLPEYLSHLEKEYQSTGEK